MYLNGVTLVGFTGRDAKTSATPGGKNITRLSVATTKRYKDAQDQWQERRNGTPASSMRARLMFVPRSRPALTSSSKANSPIASTSERSKRTMGPSRSNGR